MSFLHFIYSETRARLSRRLCLEGMADKKWKVFRFFFAPLWLKKSCTETMGWRECKDKIADSSEKSSDEPSRSLPTRSPFFIQSPIADSCLYRRRTKSFSFVIVPLASIRQKQCLIVDAFYLHPRILSILTLIISIRFIDNRR